MFNYLTHLNSHLSPYFHNPTDLEAVRDGSLTLLQQHNIDLNHKISYSQRISAIRNHLTNKPVRLLHKSMKYNDWDIFLHYITHYYPLKPSTNHGLLLTYAAGYGNLMMMKYLIKQGYPIDHEISYCVIMGGDLKAMELITDNGYQWAAKDFCCAVRARNILTMEWLLNQGCKWDSHVFEIAILYDDDEIIDWLYERGCPVDRFTSNKKINLKIEEWLERKGYLRRGEVVCSS